MRFNATYERRKLRQTDSRLAGIAYQAAVMAVTRLHETITIPNHPYPTYACKHCTTPTQIVAYPCQTRRAIIESKP